MEEKLWGQLSQTELWDTGGTVENQTAAIKTIRGKQDDVMEAGYDLESISKITSLSVIMLVSLIGNGIILVKVVRYSKVRTVMNAFVCSLSASDLLVTVFSMPLVLTYSITKSWPFGEIVCLLHHYALSMSGVCGCVMMLFISIHVYIDIIRQCQSKIKEKMVGFLIAAAWVAALVISIPWNIGANLKNLDRTSNFNGASENGCRVFLPKPYNLEVYRYISLIAMGHIIPFFFILFSLVFICSRVYSVRYKIRPLVVPLKDMLFQSEMRTATTVVTIIAVYVLCWLPYIVLLILSCVSNIDLAECWYDISIWLTWANKAVNPTIYAFRNKTVLWHLQACRKCFFRSRIRKSEKYVWKGPPALSSSIVSDKRTGNYSAAMFFARSSIDSDIALTEASGDWGIACLS